MNKELVFLNNDHVGVFFDISKKNPTIYTYKKIKKPDYNIVASMNDEDKWGVVNIENDTIIPFKYDDIDCTYNYDETKYLDDDERSIYFKNNLITVKNK